MARPRRTPEHAGREADRLISRYGGDPKKAPKADRDRLVSLCAAGENVHASREARVIASTQELASDGK